MPEDSPIHQRRVRYKGRNPRRFEERYKELNPERYAADVEHIVAKGMTPAGMHRPICVEEILAILRPQSGEIALDATLGYGGHSQRLLPLLLPGGRLYALDVDAHELPRAEARLRGLGFGEDVFYPRLLNFAGVRRLAAEVGEGFDCILADLGVSSMQLDNPARGFSYKADGPLDLRLNATRGKPAADLIAQWTAEKIEGLLRDNADEPHAAVLSRAIGGKGVCRTTGEFVALLRQALVRARPRPNEEEIKKSLQRTFMALRIEVNQEFQVLDRFLDDLPAALKPGGRVAILTFHSGEDRRVKKSFQYYEQYGLYEKAAPTPQRPTPEECRSNPRASCAKLRWAIRSDMPLP